MIKKHNYEAPDAELLVVKFEANFCETSPQGNVTSDMSRDPYEYQDL